MKPADFEERVGDLLESQERLLARANEPEEGGGGVLRRWRHPVLTAAHVPVHWRYDLDPESNPRLLERLLGGRFCLLARVEGADRKSFFAVAESASGVDRFRFRARPVVMPETDDPDVNVYDMRLTAHEDGWIYGLFCSERRDPAAAAGDLSSAIAQCGIARTRDLDTWERLPDLATRSPQQRNVVLHPELVSGRYGFYTRPQDAFIEAGSGGGIGWGLADTAERAAIAREVIVHDRAYHTVYEAKNGLGPPPIRTPQGWLQLAHGVRGTAAGLRYVLYAFMTALDQPWRVIHAPGGHLLAPDGAERVGDVSNVVFSNGWVALPSGELFVYYGASDTRCHVATTTVDALVDYCRNTPPDAGRSAASVRQRIALIERNLTLGRR